MNAAQISLYLEELLRFMQPYWNLVNCHMVTYLTENHWHRLIPSRLQNEVTNIESIENCISEVFWRSTNESEFPIFKQFKNTCEKQRLENYEKLLTTLDQLNNKMGSTQNFKQGISIREFLSEKKKHEVEATAELVDKLIQNVLGRQPENFIVDAGDGKGYLSSRLALQYKHNVLGIDFKETNTTNALERNRKLQRVWTGLVRRAEIEAEGLGTIHKSENKTVSQISNENEQKSVEGGIYKTISEFITPQLDIGQLLRNQFNTSNELFTICLTGLHTCGNLGATCLRVFHEQPQCRILCNISCCYHLLNETYTEFDHFQNKIISERHFSEGFPMSQFLHEKRVKIGRNARMLATQSLERIVSGKNVMNTSLYYRALLEVLLTESKFTSKGSVQVGKIRNYSNFEEYVTLCKKKLGIETELWAAQRVLEIQEQYSMDSYYMHLFYLVRMTFAPIIEGIILLDRLLYLKELKYENSYLVKIFDAIISPRRYGIVAWK